MQMPGINLSRKVGPCALQENDAAKIESKKHSPQCTDGSGAFFQVPVSGNLVIEISNVIGPITNSFATVTGLGMRLSRSWVKATGHFRNLASGYTTSMSDCFKQAETI